MQAVDIGIVLYVFYVSVEDGFFIRELEVGTAYNIEIVNGEVDKVIWLILATVNSSVDTEIESCISQGQFAKDVII